MSAATATRIAMRDRVKIGQAWRRNRGGEIGVIRMIHRVDRCVEILGVQDVRLVSFSDLRRYWTEVPR